MMIASKCSSDVMTHDRPLSWTLWPLSARHGGPHSQAVRPSRARW
jgi:hypothetical protein